MFGLFCLISVFISFCLDVLQFCFGWTSVCLAVLFVWFLIEAFFVFTFVLEFWMCVDVLKTSFLDD